MNTTRSERGELNQCFLADSVNKQIFKLPMRISMLHLCIYIFAFLQSTLFVPQHLCGIETLLSHKLPTREQADLRLRST